LSKVGQTNSDGADDKYKTFVSDYLQANTSSGPLDNTPIVDVHVAGAN